MKTLVICDIKGNIICTQSPVEDDYTVAYILLGGNWIKQAFYSNL